MKLSNESEFNYIIHFKVEADVIKKNQVKDSARTTVKHVEASHLFPAYHRYKGPKSDMSMIVQLLRKQVYLLESSKHDT